MLITIIVSSIVAFLLIVLFVAIFLLYRFVFYSPRKEQLNDDNLEMLPFYQNYVDRVKELIAILKARPFENIYIESFDKLKLHARLYENKNSKKVAILFHGYRGAAYRDFCCVGNEIINMGYTVIIIDQRAHGQSEGHSITFGIRESKDVETWANYARNRFGEDISLALMGVSMGGASVLIAADKVKNAKIIADCPFTSPKIALKDTLRSIKLATWIFYPLLSLSSLIFAHTNLNKLSAYDSIKNTTNDVLIIHGDVDKVVSYKISQDLYNAYPNKIHYELFEGAEHGGSYIKDTARYQKILKEFLNDN